MSKQNLGSCFTTAETKRYTLCSPAGLVRKWLVGVGVLLLVVGAAFVACDKDDDGGGGGGGSSKPSELSSDATADQALAKLNEIIAYSGTPADTKSSAETMKGNWNTYSSSWSTSKIATIPVINAMIKTLT
jgi:hypothetical protein